MDNKTQINTSINPNATIVNSEVSGSNVTVVNTEQIPHVAKSTEQPALFPEASATAINIFANETNSIAFGTVLCDKFSVLEKLDVETGEADLYICDYEKSKYIAKVYRRTVSIKKEVSDKLKAIDSPYVASIYATGEYNGYPVEIQPYYKNGSLQGKKFSFEELKSYIIPSLNEGLKVLHTEGIIHKDLKPANIMVLDDNKGVAIIDFGISSARDDGSTVIVTKTGFTPIYSAPETFRSLFLIDSDYYSLGITLYELFTGKLPYGNMTQEELEQYGLVQRIPIPRDMPKELQDLIKALTYPDITNRKEKDNPNRRWGYEEVNKWLAGEKQTLPGEGIGNKDIKPFVFLEKEYTDVHELVEAMVSNWKEAKKVLLRGYLADYFRFYDEEAYEICVKAGEEASMFVDQDDLILWRTMYQLDKQIDKIFWKGYVFNTLQDLGRSLLEALVGKQMDIPVTAGEMLSEGLLSQYLDIMGVESEEQRVSIATCEQMYSESRNDGRQQLLTLYTLAFMLSGQRLLKIEDKTFRTIGELTEYMRELQSASFEKLQPFCHKLVKREGVLDPQFEAWLLMLGKKPELDAWKGNVSILDGEDDF